MINILLGYDFSKETLRIADKIVQNYIEFHDSEYKLVGVDEDDLYKLAASIFRDEPELLKEALSPDNPCYSALADNVLHNLENKTDGIFLREVTYQYIHKIINALLNERLSFAIDLMEGNDND